MTTSAGPAPLHHEPPEPGWWPRPPDVLLRASRLERRRRRALEDLAERRAWLARTLDEARAGNRRVWAAVMPRHRIAFATTLVVVFTLFDAVSTGLLLSGGLATEANPLLADLIVRVGVGRAMLVRAAVGVGLGVALGWLATWRREARPVLAFAVVVLGLVVVLHVTGTFALLAL